MASPVRSRFCLATTSERRSPPFSPRSDRTANAKRTAAAHAIFNITGNDPVQLFILQFVPSSPGSPRRRWVVVISRDCNVNTDLQRRLHADGCRFRIRLVKTTVLIPDAKTKGAKKDSRPMCRDCAQPRRKNMPGPDSPTRSQSSRRGQAKELFSQVLRQFPKRL